MAVRWYVVHVYSGFERKVAQSIREQAQQKGLGDSISEVLVPTETVVEMRGNKRVESSRMFYPGYVLVQIECDERGHIPDNVFHAIKSTPKVTGFVGGAKNRPSPISEAEVLKIVSQMQEGVEKPRPKVLFEMGEAVRVKEGPFADFSGEIVEINEDQLKVKVLVNIFGRETPVELEFSQVAKL